MTSFQKKTAFSFSEWIGVLKTSQGENDGYSWKKLYELPTNFMQKYLTVLKIFQNDLGGGGTFLKHPVHIQNKHSNQSNRYTDSWQYVSNTSNKLPQIFIEHILLSVFLTLFSNMLTRFAHNTLGFSRSKYSWQCFTISMLLVLKSFILILILIHLFRGAARRLYGIGDLHLTILQRSEPVDEVVGLVATPAPVSNDWAEQLHLKL